jgi:hypothetical protein
MIPIEFQALFPSIDIHNLDPQKDKYFILQSLLHFSTGEAWKWMLKTYSQSEISEVIKTSTLLSPRDVYYWAYKFNLPKEEIKCLQINLQPQSQVFWNK